MTVPARFNALFGVMPAPKAPRLLSHFIVTALFTAAVLLSYFWPSGVW